MDLIKNSCYSQKILEASGTNPKYHLDNAGAWWE